VPSQVDHGPRPVIRAHRDLQARTTPTLLTKSLD
jgi:hypothetical protein